MSGPSPVRIVGTAHYADADAGAGAGAAHSAAEAFATCANSE
jgi:hypothetical protein